MRRSTWMTAAFAVPLLSLVGVIAAGGTESSVVPQATEAYQNQNEVRGRSLNNLPEISDRPSINLKGLSNDEVAEKLESARFDKAIIVDRIKMHDDSIATLNRLISENDPEVKAAYIFDGFKGLEDHLLIAMTQKKDAEAWLRNTNRDIRAIEAYISKNKLTRLNSEGVKISFDGINRSYNPSESAEVKASITKDGVPLSNTIVDVKSYTPDKRTNIRSLMTNGSGEVSLKVNSGATGVANVSITVRDPEATKSRITETERFTFNGNPGSSENKK